MKKIISSILIVALLALSLFSLSACGGNKYPPVESTEEESRVVMTLEVGGEKFEVKYELYRAIFLSLRDEIDSGDRSVWSGENKDEYISKIHALITEKAAQIYSAFVVCDSIGIDVYSKEFEDKIDDYITLSVDGGWENSIKISGFDGDYDKYLASLKEMNLNYAVQKLLLRYSIALEKIELYYAGNLDSEEYLGNAVMGKLEYTRDDVRDFYYSEEAVRVIRVALALHFGEARALEIRNTAASMGGEEEFANYLIHFSPTGGPDIKDGEVFGKYSHNPNYYQELVDAAFALSTFEVSQPIEIITGEKNGYNILYRAIKSEDNFEKCYDKIAAAYVQNEIGRILSGKTDELVSGAAVTDVLKELDYSNISMD